MCDNIEEMLASIDHTKEGAGGLFERGLLEGLIREGLLERGLTRKGGLLERGAK